MLSEPNGSFRPICHQRLGPTSTYRGTHKAAVGAFYLHGGRVLIAGCPPKASTNPQALFIARAAVLYFAEWHEVLSITLPKLHPAAFVPMLGQFDSGVIIFRFAITKQRKARNLEGYAGPLSFPASAG